MSTGTQHPLIPMAWQHTVVDSLHGLSRPGIQATQKLITAQFVWPGIYQCVCLPLDPFLCTVPTCEDSVTLYRPTLFFPPNPSARFDVIHIDVIGPLPPSRGFTYLLTCVDRFTRWPEAIPLASWQKLWLKPSSVVGSLALVSCPLLLLTVVDNSSASYGVVR